MANMMNDTSKPCAAMIEAEKVVKAADNLGRAMRRLKRARNACERCASYDDCPIARRIQSEINAAIQTVSDEWTLP
jgi:hypothetical protein